MFTFVTGRQLNTDTSLTFRHNRIIETGYINAFFLHLGSEVLRQFCIIQHHCTDSALSRLDIETGSQHLVAEISYIVHQLSMQCIAFFQHLEHFKAGAHDGRSNRVREQIRTRTLTQHVDDFFSTCSETTHSTAECLTQCTGKDIHTSVNIILFSHTMTGRTHYTGRMRFVYHYQRIVFFCQFANLIHRSHITVHREHTVSSNDTVALSLSFLQAAFQVSHVCIGITITFCLTQTHTVNDRSVVQCIGNDCILVGQQRFEQTTVCIKAGSI